MGLSTEQSASIAAWQMARSLSMQASDAADTLRNQLLKAESAAERAASLAKEARWKMLEILDPSPTAGD